MNRAIKKTMIGLTLGLTWFISVAQSEMPISDILDQTMVAAEIEAYLKYASQLAITQHEKAAEYLEKAKKLAEENGQQQGLAKTYLNMGTLYTNQGKLSEAIEPLLAALDYAPPKTDTLLRIEILLATSNAYLQLRSYPEARKALREAVTLSSLNTDRQSLGRVYSQFAHFYWQAHPDSFQVAYQYLQEAIPIQTSINDEKGLANSYANLAITLESDGRPREAKKYYRDAITLSERVRDTVLLARNYLNYGSFLTKQQQYQSGLRFLQKAEQLINLLNNVFYQSQNYLFLSNCYADLREPEKALHYYRRYNSAKDEIFNEQKARELAAIQNEYESRQQKQALELLKQEARIRQTELDHQSFLQRLFTIGFILSLLVLAFFIRSFNIKMKAEKALAQKDKEINQSRLDELQKQHKITALNALLKGEENARRHISEEVHEELGSIISAVQFNFQSLKSRFPDNSPAIDQTNLLVNQAVSEIRRISHQIMPGALIKLGLNAAIGDLCQRMEKVGLEVDFHSAELEDLRLNSSIELTTYQLVQKYLESLVKQSHATQAFVQLTKSGQQLDLIIEADRKQLTTKPNSDEETFDLHSIESYVNYLDASMEIQPKRTNGSMLKVSIPLGNT